MRYKKTANFGFTLLELLVVIGIISILVGLGAVSYSTSQRKSRDAKRKSDVKILQNSLEQYYSVCGFNYPTPETGIYPAIICTNPTTAILPTAPVDPRTTTPYPCTGCTSTGYSLCTTLESESPDTYCVTNQQ